MTAWQGSELARIGAAEEVEIAPRRHAGTLAQRVTVWAVDHGDGVYVRSAVKGRNAAWFRGVRATHEGRIWAGGIAKDVTFEDADPGVYDDVDAAYRAKYCEYTGRILNSVLTPEARSTTLKLVPRPPRS
jgi:hypothetical protein